MRSRTVHADTAFQYGLAAIGASQAPGVTEARRDALLDEAIGVFHAMLVKRPELVRVRLELGRAFFLKGEDGLARRNFEQVLAGKPPARVALNINRFLTQIRARKRWTMRVGMALAPDTNIGAGSDERIVYIHGLPFRRDQEELTSSGIGISAWAGGEYQYPFGNPATSRWRLRAGADVWRREYRDEEFDRMSVSAHGGPALADRADERGERSGERAPAVAGERAGPPGRRHPRGGAAPPEPAHDGERAALLTRPGV